MTHDVDFVKLWRIMQKNPLAFAGGVIEAARDQDSRMYMIECAANFYRGAWGDIPPEDVEANNEELTRPAGRVVARYPARFEMKQDVYVICYFSEEEPSRESNYTTICYVSDY